MIVTPPVVARAENGDAMTLGEPAEFVDAARSAKVPDDTPLYGHVSTRGKLRAVAPGKRP